MAFGGAAVLVALAMGARVNAMGRTFSDFSCQAKVGKLDIRPRFRTFHQDILRFDAAMDDRVGTSMQVCESSAHVLCIPLQTSESTS